MRILLHLMSTEEMDEFFAVVKIDAGENQWTQELNQVDIRLADELADPGPRGNIDLTPLIFAEGALIVTDNNHDDNNDVVFIVWRLRGYRCQ